MDKVGACQREARLLAMRETSEKGLPHPIAPVPMDMGSTRMVGSLENVDNIMLRLVNGTRPSIWTAGMPWTLSMLARISRVRHQDVKTTLLIVRTGKILRV